MNKSLESLKRLQAGNQRYVNNDSQSARHSRTRRSELVEGQHPFAIILGCADSRAPAEMIFDQGLGDLFVIRVAGNVAAPTQVGSIEFAASKFGVPLCVVLGHTHCGAIAATIDAIQSPSDSNGEDSIHSIVECIGPAISDLVDGTAESGTTDLMAAATRRNVEACVTHLQQQSPLLKQLIANDQFHVIGAQYDIETGVVEFYDGN